MNKSWIQVGKIGGGIVAIVLMLILLIAVNYLMGSLRWRADLTEEKIYTLSQNTRAVLEKLDRDVTLKFYFNGSAPEIPAPLKTFAKQVEDLLHEYALASHGRLVVETYDPAPDTEIEEWAQRYGVSGQPMRLGGPMLYLGVVAVAGDQQATLPVIDPRLEEMMEYDLTRLIYRVSHPRRPTVGVLSSLPVLGSEPPPFMMPGQRPPNRQPAWAAFQSLQQDYDVRKIDTMVAEIDTNIDTLIVVHPKELPDETLYAIDQFVLRGGRLMAFVDPMCTVDLESNQAQGMGMPRASSDLKRLFTAWGIAFDTSKIVVDLNSSTTTRRGNNVEQNPLYLSLVKANFDPNDILTASPNSILMPFAGAFATQGKTDLKVTPLITSTEKSMLANSFLAQFGADAINREFHSGNEKLNLAVRLQGNFITAFPEGRPRPGSEDDKSQPPPPTLPGLTNSIKPGAVILVGDVDILYDPYCVEKQMFLAWEANRPRNDNIALFINATEQMSGSAELIGIRGRGRTDRPFTRVQALARAAQEKWMAQERDINAKMQEAQQRLDTLQAQKDDKQRFILSPAQQKEIEGFKQELLKYKSQRRDVNKGLREGIEQLGMQLKVLNILGMPLLIGLFGIGYAYYRQSKNTRRQH